MKSIGEFGNIIDVTKADIKGHGGKGTFHHLAFRANNDYDHQFWKELITRLGYKTTDILDRKYFKSFYFREHGHILFEIATDNPGFIVDENLVSLGEGFMLPNMHEHYRIFLENKLVKLKLNRGKRRNK